MPRFVTNELNVVIKFTHYPFLTRMNDYLLTVDWNTVINEVQLMSKAPFTWRRVTLILLGVGGLGTRGG